MLLLRCLRMVDAVNDMTLHHECACTATHLLDALAVLLRIPEPWRNIFAKIEHELELELVGERCQRTLVVNACVGVQLTLYLVE